MVAPFCDNRGESRKDKRRDLRREKKCRVCDLGWLLVLESRRVASTSRGSMLYRIKPFRDAANMGLSHLCSKEENFHFHRLLRLMTRGGVAKIWDCVEGRS